MTTITYAFTAIPNNLISSTAPAEPIKLLAHMVNRQKIPGWKMRTSEICATLGLTKYAVKKALKWLQENGYAYYERIKNRYTQWHFSFIPFDSATKADKNKCVQVEIEPFSQVENRPGIYKKESLGRKEKQQHEPETVQALTEIKKEIEKPVVVNDFIFPKELDESLKPGARIALNKCKNEEIRQEVMFTFAYHMATKQIANPVGYLTGIINNANNGTFIATGAKPTLNSNKLRSPIFTGHKETAKIDNDKFLKELEAEYQPKNALFNKVEMKTDIKNAFKGINSILGR